MHYAGDAVLAQFTAALDAVSSATTIQCKLNTRNEALPEERRVRFRIGVNLGDVIEDRGDIYGDGVNVAARLEALAEPDGVCISDAVRTAIGNRLPFHSTFIGEHSVKNIKEPVRAYRLFAGSAASTTSPPPASTSIAATAQPIGKPSLAIKPFKYVGADSDQDHLADGLTKGLIVSLMKVAGLTLIEDDSPSMVESKQMTVQELGQRFNVRYVLRGSIRRHGRRIRVGAELMELSSGRYVWAENFDRNLQDFGDLFNIQDEIVEEIVTTMDIKLLSGEAARMVRKAFKNSQALENYYRGEELLWRSTTKPELQEAQRLLEEAIRLEPESPVGNANAALAHWMGVVFGMSDLPSKSLERAVVLAHEAISLEDVTGYPHLVMAYVYLSDREYDRAMTEASLAVSDRPSCPASYSLKANVLNYLGRSDDAIELAQYAMRLTPVHPPMYPAILASAYYGAGRYEDAITAAKATIDLGSHSVDPYLVLIASNVALGCKEEAASVAQKVLDLDSRFNLAEFANSQPFKEQKNLDILVAQLESAGLK